MTNKLVVSIKTDEFIGNIGHFLDQIEVYLNSRLTVVRVVLVRPQNLCLPKYSVTLKPSVSHEQFMIDFWYTMDFVLRQMHGKSKYEIVQLLGDRQDNVLRIRRVG